MANIILKEKARELRKKHGLSIKTISDRLGVSKSTTSYWCRDILLSKIQIIKLLKRQKELSIKGSLEYSEKLRKERIDWENKYRKLGFADTGALSGRDIFMLGIALYWAEGYKKGNTEVGFTNSDPEMIRLIIKWFKDVYGIDKKNLIFRVSINQIHKSREKQILEFWSSFLKIPISQFTKTSYIKSLSKKIYQNNTKYFGILRVKVRRGVNLRSRILGAIESLYKN